jgi:hypothetical protein
MKKIITFSLLVSLVLMGACRKAGNGNLPDLERVPVPSLKKEAGSDAFIVVSALSSFQGKLVVDNFFKDDIPPKSMDVVAFKNGNKSIIKVIKAGITSFPTTVIITAADLQAAFGPIVICDYFTFGVNMTTKSGKVYEAFPAVGVAYGAGVSNQFGGVQTQLDYSTKVEYDPSVYKGNFITVSDEFQDFPVGSVVPITQIDATSFSFIQPATVNPIPMVVTVDPNTLRASITKQKIGDKFTWASYTNPNAAASATDPYNKVSPCDKTLQLNITYTVDQGSFGSYKLVLRKQ